MHAVVSWDINEEGALRESISKELEEAIKEYSPIRPLTTFYVVKIDDQVSWNALVLALQTVAQKYSGKVLFVISPLMAGGNYNGWLPLNVWTELNELST